MSGKPKRVLLSTSCRNHGLRTQQKERIYHSLEKKKSHPSTNNPLPQKPPKSPQITPMPSRLQLHNHACSHFAKLSPVVLPHSRVSHIIRSVSLHPIYTSNSLPLNSTSKYYKNPPFLVSYPNGNRDGVFFKWVFVFLSGFCGGAGYYLRRQLLSGF